ncbi:MAG: heat-inducible transcriptional repressor HrcA, partial [Cutibacterium avidum]|nr:heat-inducible transcriptional repressor HrcA [Cutibacterium avidum]
MLDDRKLDVLKAIVTDYVSSKEPVGSKALVERHGLRVSPATVRNDMAVLEEEGYVTHPHTSAGRIPTDKGYRLFVDRIATLKPLSGPERRAIQAFMTGAVDLDDIVRRTVRLLAQITHQVAIMQYPVATTATIRHLELVSLSTDRILIVLIMSSGSVEQRIVELPGHDEQNLVALRTRLNQALVGLTVAEAVDSLNRLLDELGPAEGPRATSVVATVLEILAVDPSARVVVAGVPNHTAFGAQGEATCSSRASKTGRTVAA